MVFLLYTFYLILVEQNKSVQIETEFIFQRMLNNVSKLMSNDVRNDALLIFCQ